MSIESFGALIRLREVLVEKEWLLDIRSEEAGESEADIYSLDEVAEKKMESLIISIEVFCFKQNLSVKQFMDILYERYWAADKLDIPLENFPGYDFYKQIDVNEFYSYLKEKYQDRTARCYLSYFERYASIFFSSTPDVELFKFKPHKRSWILQAIKRFGDYYFRKYNNREVTQLIRQIIERYDLNKDLI